MAGRLGYFCLTVWLSTADVAPFTLASPPYAALIECVPRASDEVENDAMPPDRVPVPSKVEPS